MNIIAAVAARTRSTIMDIMSTIMSIIMDMTTSTTKAA